MPATRHFRSKAAYMRNLAYRHMHGIAFTATRVCIRGKCHRVKHSTNAARVRIDARQRRKEARRSRR